MNPDPSPLLVDEVLPNGMGVRLYKTTRCGPKLRAQCVYNFGSNAEVSDAERGLAHVNEHMIFKGTRKGGEWEASTLETRLRTTAYNQVLELGERAKWTQAALEARGNERIEDPTDRMLALTTMGALHLSECDIDKTARYYGAGLNAFTSQDKTSYYFEVGKNALTPFLCILSASVSGARLDPNHLRSELFAVLNEMSMGIDNDMRAAIGTLRRQLYAVNEAGHYDTIGSETDLLRLNDATLRAFYDKHYRPSNATLYVTGDIDDPKALFKQIKQLFGSIADRGGVSEPATPPPAPPPRQSVTTLFRAVPAPTLVYGFRIPGGKLNRDGKAASAYYTPRAAALALGGINGAHLTEVLVHCKRPLASSVDCFVEQYQDSGEFYICIEPTGGADSRASIEEALRTALEDWHWSSSIEATVRAQLTHGHVDTHTELSELTNHWVDTVGTTGDASLIFDDPGKAKLDVPAFCAEHLRLDRSAVVVLTPHSQCSDYASYQAKRNAVRATTEAKVRATNARNFEAWPLEKAHTALGLPKQQPYVLEDFDTVMPTAPLSYIDPDTFHKTQCVASIPTARALGRSLEGLEVSLAQATVSKAPSHQASIQTIEAKGATLSIGMGGASFEMMPLRSVADEEAVFAACGAALTPRSWDPVVDQASFFQARSAMVRGLLGSAESGMATVAHCLSQAMLPPSERWDLAEAAQHVEDLSPERCFDRWKAHWGACTIAQSGPRPIVWGPPQCGSPLPDPTEGGSYAPSPMTHHFEKSTDQVVIGLARRGRCTTSDPEFRRCMSLLQVIAFRSLGSRIYAIREQTGLFYSASGAFGLDATPEDPGLDRILTRVKPVDVERAIAALRAFTDGMAEAPSITEAELHSAQSIVADSWVDSLHPNALAHTMLRLNRSHPGQTLHKLPRATMEAILLVTVEEMNEFARQQFALPFDLQCTFGPVATNS